MCKRLLAVLIVLIATGGAALAEGQPLPSDYDEMGEMLVRMEELVDQAIYHAASAILTHDVHDRELHLQAVLNLLEGPESPDYDGENPVTVAPDEGLRRMFLNALTVRMQITRGPSVTPLVPLPHAYTFVDAWEQVDASLRLAYLSASEAMEKLYGHDEDPLRALYAYLIVARGRPQESFPIGGLATLLALLPPMQRWVAPGESIQEAIDATPAGGTVHIEPGTYREPLTISKSITLQGGGTPADPDLDLGETVLQGFGWHPTLLVDDDDPIVVTIRGITIHGGAYGVRASGSVHVDLADVTIAGTELALGARDSAVLRSERCTIQGNVRAAACGGTASLTLLDCALRESSAVGDAAIVAIEDARLTVHDTTITDGRGDGIYLQQRATLDLVGCEIAGNAGFGLRVFSEGCTLYAAPELEDAAFVGEVTGWANCIPNPGEPRGNAAGDVCPEAYRFLLEASPQG